MYETSTDSVGGKNYTTSKKLSDLKKRWGNIFPWQSSSKPQSTVWMPAPLDQFTAKGLGQRIKAVHREPSNFWVPQWQCLNLQSGKSSVLSSWPLNGNRRDTKIGAGKGASYSLGAFIKLSSNVGLVWVFLKSVSFQKLILEEHKQRSHTRQLEWPQSTRAWMLSGPADWNIVLWGSRAVSVWIVLRSLRANSAEMPFTYQCLD